MKQNALRKVYGIGYPNMIWFTGFTKQGKETIMASDETIIQLKHMGKEFKTANGPVKALDDINLEIRRGEIFGIIGLSGAGKSTLVRCINMLEIPTSGEVIFEGENLAGRWMLNMRICSFCSRI